MTSLVSFSNYSPLSSLATKTIKPENRGRKSFSSDRYRQNVTVVLKSDDCVLGRRKRRKRGGGRSGSSSFVAISANGDDVDVDVDALRRPEKKTTKKTKREKKPLKEIASNLFTALKPVRLRDDDSEAAQELKAILELARSRPSDEGDVSGVRERIRAEAKKESWHNCREVLEGEV